MSLTPLHRDQVLRRVVALPAAKGQETRIVLHFRWSESNAQWEMAAAPAGRLRRKLRWQRLAAVLWEAFHLDVASGRQLTLAESRGGGG